jgi:hypothetical protein
MPARRASGEALEAKKKPPDNPAAFDPTDVRTGRAD